MSARRTRIAVLTSVLLIAVPASGKVFEPTVTANDEKGVVHLYRPAAESPGLAKPLRRAYPEILLDGEPVGILPYNRYLSFQVPPGAHVVRVTGLTGGAKKWELRDLEQKISIQAGETLFLRLRVEYNLEEMNIGQPKPSYRYWLSPVDARDAPYEIRETSAVR